MVLVFIVHTAAHLCLSLLCSVSVFKGGAQLIHPTHRHTHTTDVRAEKAWRIT